MNTNYEAVKATLERMLRMTEANGASVNEAAFAAKKAQEMATAYGIDMASLSQEQDRGGGYSKVEVKRTLYFLQINMFGQIAEMNQCKFLVHPRGMDFSGYTLFGKKSQIEITQYLFDAINNCLYAMAEQIYMKEFPRRQCKSARSPTGHTDAFGIWEASFLTGAIDVIIRRMKEGKDMHVAQVGCQALMVTMDTELNKQFALAFPRLGSVTYRRTHVGDMDAYARGQQFGRSLVIHDGIEG